MSRFTKLFIVVEGKSTDVWFYDEIIRQSGSLSGEASRIYPVEFVSRGLDGKDSGAGKKRVISLFKYLSSTSGFTLESGGSRRTMAFCVDADHDHVVDSKIEDDHFIYTELPDAEAHLAEAVDLHLIGRRMLSASAADATAYVRSLEGWRDELAQSWREWFVLCLTYYYGGLRELTPGTPPATSNKGMRQLDSGELSRKIRDFELGPLSGEDKSEAVDLAKKRIDEYFDSDEEAQLLKGKWLISYLKEKSNEFARQNGLQRIKNDEAVREAMKAAVSFTPPWIDYYLTRFHAIAKVG
jgi:hypothetical protein